MTIGERIKERRFELGISQTDLADEMGVTAPSISQYERGIRLPSREALFKLAKTLQVSVAYIAEGTEHPDIFHDNYDKKMWDLYHALSLDEKDEVLSYMQYMAWKKQNSSGGG